LVTHLSESSVILSQFFSRGAFLVRASLAAVLTISLTASQQVSPSNAQSLAETTVVESTVAAASATTSGGNPIGRGAAQDPWHKRWWIEKTARLLRGGDGIGPQDDINALMALPKETIARQFMEDPRFGDTALDFNMYYLGFKVDSLKDNGVYLRNAFDFPNAVASAQALLTGGDYLKLFDLEGPLYLAPLPMTLNDPLSPSEARLSPPALRKKVVEQAEQMLQALVEMGADPRTKPLDYCAEVEDVWYDSALHDTVARAFNDPEVFVLLRGRVMMAPLETLKLAYLTACYGKPEAKIDIKPLVETAKAAIQRMDRAFTEILKFEPTVYQPRTVLDFRPFDLATFGMNRWTAFGYEQSNALRNSSTNLNRKRGAYVLKRFFCDDLTPVGFETPKDHVTGVHGSDTTCFNCHYKLDPMAGFFRNYGASFFDYSRQTTLEFDDEASVDRGDYVKAWLAPPNAPRQWNVGYIRSPGFEEHNAYGQSLADLSRIIRGAPEAKRCLMRRLFEYSVAEDQTIDGGYLDDMTKTFEREAAENSSTAMKHAFLRIVLSETFDQADPDPRQCYDLAPGETTANAPPCRVAFILQKNCAKCHGAGGRANLNLTAWIPDPGGTGHTFPHLDRHHKQRTARDTMARMAARLSSSDPAVRMPRMTVMDSRERQELFLWAQEELTRTAKAQRP
jgi:hypothetical protein